MAQACCSSSRFRRFYASLPPLTPPSPLRALPSPRRAGHGGIHAAEFVKANLYNTLLAHPKFPADPVAATVESYEAIDAQYCSLGANRDDGCTAVTALVQGSRLIVANVGDSRAILCRAGRAIQLSIDHKPNAKEERQRVERAGGVVVWAGTWRVGGVLAVSRAFGDKPLKRYVSGTPDVRDERLTPEDEFLILASDGLWDVCMNQARLWAARGRRVGAERARSAARVREEGGWPPRARPSLPASSPPPPAPLLTAAVQTLKLFKTRAGRGGPGARDQRPRKGREAADVGGVRAGQQRQHHRRRHPLQGHRRVALEAPRALRACVCVPPCALLPIPHSGHSGFVALPFPAPAPRPAPDGCTSPPRTLPPPSVPLHKPPLWADDRRAPNPSSLPFSPLGRSRKQAASANTSKVQQRDRARSPLKGTLRRARRSRRRALPSRLSPLFCTIHPSPATPPTFPRTHASSPLHPLQPTTTVFLCPT